MTNTLKKIRSIWLSDEEFKLLKEKASLHYQGKGNLEAFLRDIAYNQIIILKGKGMIEFKVLNQ